MAIADTSFLIRAIEFQQITFVEDKEEILITAEVKSELEEKDSDTIRKDRQRVEELIQSKPRLSGLEFENLSSFEDTLSAFLLRQNSDYLQNNYDLREYVEANDFPSCLEDGELSCAIECKEKEAELLIDDFIAYNELFSKLDGNINSLCEFIINNSEKDSVNHQKCIVAMDRLFIPYEDMSLAVKSRIRRKIESFLDSEFNDLTHS